MELLLERTARDDSGSWGQASWLGVAGASVLHLAARYGHHRVLEKLLQNLPVLG